MKRSKLIPVILFCLCFIMPLGLANHAKAKEKKENVYADITASIPHHIIKKGTSVNIKTTGTANGKKITKFSYTSENKKVATVDKNGKIKVIATGDGRIRIDSLDYPGNKTWVNFTVPERIIKVSGIKNCRAGNTYQLKASEKDVIWYCDSLSGENANPSIDSKTGELKVRNAGTIYVKCSSRDGKGLGAVYIYAAGPVIEDQNITLDPIIIDSDEHFVNTAELVASGKIPNKVTVPYTDGEKKGKVDISIDWDLFSYDDIYDEAEKYTIRGYLKEPEGYLLKGQGGEFLGSNIKIDVDFKTLQTDTRKKITAIEKVEDIILTEDKYITDVWDVLKDVKLKCKLEDDSTVEFPLGYIRYDHEIKLSKAGTYTIKLYPGTITGFVTGKEDDVFAEIKIEVVKGQTYKEVPATLDMIAPESWVIEYTSQDPIR